MLFSSPAFSEYMPAPIYPRAMCPKTTQSVPNPFSASI